MVGSYFGSYLEEKIALGTNVFIVEINFKKMINVINDLKKENFKIFKIKSGNDENIILMILGARKKANKIVSIIKANDKNAFILSEKVKVAK